MASFRSVFHCLLGGASLLLLSASALANPQAPAGNTPPQTVTAENPVPAMPPEIMIEPQASADQPPATVPPVVPQGCVYTDIMAQDTGMSLPAFYRTGPVRGSAAVPDATGLKYQTLGMDSGELVLGGQSYKLERIAADPIPAFPVSSVQYSLGINFVHKAASGETVVIKAPVIEGRANIGAQQMVTATAGGDFDPNNLLPAMRSYSLIAKTDGENCAVENRAQYFMLMTPIELSPKQIERLQTAC